MNDEICTKRGQHFMYKITAEIKAYTLFLIQQYLRKIKRMESKYTKS